MRLVAVALAEPIGNERIEPLTIRVEGRRGGNAASLAALSNLQDEDASAIATALHESLPQGTFNRLVARLLHLAAGNLEVR